MSLTLSRVMRERVIDFGIPVMVEHSSTVRPCFDLWIAVSMSEISFATFGVSMCAQT